MRIAFYTPLNSPDDGTPSGDRLIARMMIQALRNAGHEIEPVSRLRSLDKHGDGLRQKRLEEIGAQLADRLAKRMAARPAHLRPAIWLTYHLYHKAPDWLGPRIAARLGIPYAVAEASFAPKQVDGPWARGHAAVAAALRQADLVIGFNSVDAACVRPLLRSVDRYVQLKPFIAGERLAAAARNSNRHRARLREELAIASGQPLLLAVGMMRDGAKLASYRLLADALAQLGDQPWHLAIVGDGPKRSEVEAAMAVVAPRISFLGRRSPEQLPEIYAAADLFVWPAIKEALGMCFLEAQAAGVPVIGSRTLGVPDVVADGKTGLLVPPADAGAFAAAIACMLRDDDFRQRCGRAASAYFATDHDLATAGPRLANVLEQLARRPQPDIGSGEPGSEVNHA